MRSLLLLGLLTAAGPVLAAPANEPAPLADVTASAAKLVEDARTALSKHDPTSAIGLLNQALRLPPNPYSKEAQELIGVTYERLGETARARREYELFLKLYPDGADATRVRQRLLNLSATAPAAALRAPRRHESTLATAYGGISQYYYRGNSQIEILPNQLASANPLDKTTLALTDQSSLITNLDFTARYRTAESDQRFVLRESNTQNFLPNGRDYNRLNSAYYDYRNRPGDYGLRIGRQPGNSGGVLGRFDGITAGTAILSKWRLNVVAGTPADYYKIDSDRRFKGINSDLGTFAEHWSGNIYFLEQTVDDFVDRNAGGAELRYFDPQRSFFALADYDTSYQVWNTTFVQGQWLTDGGTNWTAMVDRRKTPSMQTTNALMGETTTSIAELVQLLGYEEVRRRARALTATADMAMLGLSRPITTKWQLGGDVRTSSISAIEGTTNVPAAPATGTIYTYTLQAIGTGALLSRDVSVVSMSWINGKTFDGRAWSVSERALLGLRWTAEISYRYYTQQDLAGTQLVRTTPMLRGSFRAGESVNLEAEYGAEHSQTDGVLQSETSTRKFWMLGYRWDF